MTLVWAASTDEIVHASGSAIVATTGDAAAPYLKPWDAVLVLSGLWCTLCALHSDWMAATLHSS